MKELHSQYFDGKLLESFVNQFLWNIGGELESPSLLRDEDFQMGAIC